MLMTCGTSPVAAGKDVAKCITGTCVDVAVVLGPSDVIGVPFPVFPPVPYPPMLAILFIDKFSDESWRLSFFNVA